MLLPNAKNRNIFSEEIYGTSVRISQPFFNENILSLVLRIFLYLEALECNITSDRLNRMFCYIQIYKILEKKTKNILKNGWCVHNQDTKYQTCSN